MKILRGICAVILAAVLSGCAGNGKGADGGKLSSWLKTAELSDSYTKDELYKAALSEETLVVYSVSGRAFQAKEAFERDYPGLSVDIKDIRSNDVVEMLKANYDSGNFACDAVICSDCDGSFYKELLEKDIIFTYIPRDISPKMKQEGADFLGEAMMLFYNTEIFDEVPVNNIWELCEEQYRGKIMMSSPLSSFSTYGFCAQTLRENEKLSEAYREYAGVPLEIPEGKTAGEVFWESFAGNIVFVNSNDEVLEGIGNGGDIMFGIMISSKLRYRELGYHFEPITRLMPFSAVYTPNCIALVGGSENVNCAKLFIRYILGETNGDSDGAAAFRTEGSWSARNDMPDGSSIPLSEIDIISIDKTRLYENRESTNKFFAKLLEDNIL